MFRFFPLLNSEPDVYDSCPPVCSAGKRFIEANGNRPIKDILTKRDWINDSQLQTPTEITQHILDVRYEYTIIRSENGLDRRINNDRKIEMVGRVPLFAMQCVVDYIAENEMRKPNEWLYLLDEDPSLQDSWTKVLKALSLTHRAFTPQAQRALRTSHVLSGPSLDEFAFNPICGPWVEKLDVSAFDSYNSNEEKTAAFSTRLGGYLRSWNRILTLTPNLTSLLFHSAFETDRQFKSFIQALGELKSLEVLQLKERARYLPLDMDYDHLADFYVCISKLDRLSYLSLLANENHKDIIQEPVLREDLNKLTPPPSLKTLFLSDYFVHESYLKWLVEGRGGYGLENLHVSGSIGHPSVLRGGLRSVIRLQLDRLDCSEIAEEETRIVNELISACSSLESLYIANMDELHALTALLPRTLLFLELGEDERLYNSYGPREMTIVEAKLPNIIKETWLKLKGIDMIDSEFKLRKILIHQGAFHRFYTQLEGTCRDYKIELEIANSTRIGLLSPFKWIL